MRISLGMDSSMQVLNPENEKIVNLFSSSCQCHPSRNPLSSVYQQRTSVLRIRIRIFLWRPKKEQIPRWGGKIKLILDIKVHYMLTDYLDRSEHLQFIISSVSDPDSPNPGSGSRPFSESGSGSSLFLNTDPDRIQIQIEVL
jgi:hypothetical protein